MWKSFFCRALALLLLSLPAVAAPTTSTAPSQEAVAESRVVAVTVYQGTALVTRDVQVNAGAGMSEVVVSPLPPETIDSSLYTEGTEGIRVLSTRFRSRAVKEDTRREVRAKEDEVRGLQDANQLLQKQMEVAEENLRFYTKLETFTSATLQQLTDKGLLNSESTIKLANFIMDGRAERGKSLVVLHQQIEANNQSIAFAQRQLSELAAGADRTEREAVIVLDKAGVAAGSVRLNYLVNAATWRPLYKFRAGEEKNPIQLEYLAAIEQQSGEEWRGVEVVLSTAQPTLTAVPPELLALQLSVSRGENAAAGNVRSKGENYRFAQELRRQAQQAQLDAAPNAPAADILNGAAANEQFADLLAREDAESDQRGVREGPSVAYHLSTRLTVPSKNDQQLVEVARLEMAPAYFYKTVPVLSTAVYRLAGITNQSKYVLLPGEATMYLGSDFVGRMNLPLVAIGEQFIVGLGVDPQLQVERQLVAKNRTIQGGNQVQSYDYRIRVSSFKTAPVQLQVWDRLPEGEAESVAVELVKSSPELTTDPSYLRSERPKNLLRWDLAVNPGASGEKAETVSYEFRLQYDRNVTIGNFAAKK